MVRNSSSLLDIVPPLTSFFFKLSITASFSSLTIRAAATTQTATTARGARAVSSATTLLTDRRCRAPVVPVL